jgi:hypothetical protein
MGWRAEIGLDAGVYRRRIVENLHENASDIVGFWLGVV